MRKFFILLSSAILFVGTAMTPATSAADEMRFGVGPSIGLVNGADFKSDFTENLGLAGAFGFAAGDLNNIGLMSDFIYKHRIGNGTSTVEGAVYFGGGFLLFFIDPAGASSNTELAIHAPVGLSIDVLPLNMEFFAESGLLFNITDPFVFGLGGGTANSQSGFVGRTGIRYFF